MTKDERQATIRSIPGLPGVCIKSGKGARAERVHAHREHSISIVRSGATNVRIANRTQRLTDGQCLYIPPGIPHLCSPENPEDFSYEVLYLTEGAAKNLHIDTPSEVLVGASGTQPLTACFAGDCGQTGRYVRDFFMHCIRNPQRIDGSFAPIPDFRTKNAEHTEDKQSRYQIYRKSLRRFGIGPHSLDLNIRIERSKKLLVDGLSVADTAAACGFFDQSHFVHIFRLYTGLTPTDYRNR